MRVALAVTAALASALSADATNVLFDASHHEMAGNADWVVDADAWNLDMPAYPCTGALNVSRHFRAALRRSTIS